MVDAIVAAAGKATDHDRVMRSVLGCTVLPELSDALREAYPGVSCRRTREALVETMLRLTVPGASEASGASEGSPRLPGLTGASEASPAHGGDADLGMLVPVEKKPCGCSWGDVGQEQRLSSFAGRPCPNTLLLASSASS